MDIFIISHFWYIDVCHINQNLTYQLLTNSNSSNQIYRVIMFIHTYECLYMQVVEDVAYVSWNLSEFLSLW